MFRRTALSVARAAPRAPIAARSFSAARIVRQEAKNSDPVPGQASADLKSFSEIKTEEDLLPPGAPPGTMPTDLNQSTGLERLEILGKMQGIDIFDMKPLDSSRKGTLADPIVVRSMGEEQYVGCCGVPADSHHQLWLVISRDRPIERCSECGNVIKMEYVGPEVTDHGHHDHHGADHDGVHNYEGEPKTMADFVKPEYR
ncbi:COX5B-domain-containing protein [Trichodelitschia bisporula]|uniref:Cytochrome c oxidase subunit 4, mitochondrial n=1 Tax=Trichodelitschia bisporula TaxID=703511 RepID=A0A6G1I7S9_9PEZI|nr:COX5B-domain-containing protein [Trichodelitschia bisporula]